ncbi:MAG TPA: sigma-70 family RNA polymerase sigma factor [Fimbriimonadaceae bacterium]|nr:sigma-70 family RNA polymerase sigma factor [Fimbriimonadaceae bacterium]
MNTINTTNPTHELSRAERAEFERQMNRTYRKVFDLAYRLSRSRSDAEDLTQEAFVRALKAYRSYEGDRPFENWIFRIVTRLYLDLRRNRDRRVKTVSYDAPLTPDGSDDSVHFEAASDELTPVQALLSQELSEEMVVSLKQLSPEQRELIWMADVEGLPYKEIADRIHAPVGTVRSRLHRAHKQLRALLAGLRVSTPSLGGLPTAKAAR